MSTGLSSGKNRFLVKRTGRRGYHSPREYAQALGSQLTPDIWDAIVVRAIQDATLGKGTLRTKARDFLAKYVLDQPKEIALPVDRTMPDSMGVLLTEMFQILRDAFMKTVIVEGDENRAARDAMALTLARLTPEERQFLRESLVLSETPDAQTMVEDMDRQMQPLKEELERSEPQVRIVLPPNRRERNRSARVP